MKVPATHRTLTPDSSAAEHTIDITTFGARTGLPHRIEVWFHGDYRCPRPAKPS